MLNYFDSISGNSSVTAQLYSPTNKLIFNGTTDRDSSLFTLTENGSYRLVIDGNNTTTGDYSFNLQDLAAANSLKFATSIAGSLDDSISANQINATLYAPNGSPIFSHSSIYDSQPYTLTQDGTYHLIVSGSSGNPNYSFQLLDVKSAPQINYSTPVKGSLNPGQTGFFYKFQAEEGERLYLDSITTNAPNGNYRWKLYDRGNNQIWDSTLQTDGKLIVPRTGQYYLYIQGGSNSQKVDYEFRVLTYDSSVNRDRILPGTGEAMMLLP